jgi:hypothetical protein
VALLDPIVVPTILIGYCHSLAPERCEWTISVWYIEWL